MDKGLTARWPLVFSLWLLGLRPVRLAPGRVSCCRQPRNSLSTRRHAGSCGTIVDPDGNAWMVGTHIAEPTPQEMKKAMKEQAAGAAAAS